MSVSAAPTEAVSILVPTYNRAGYLVSCLDALLSQVQPGDEILVINDGSSDDTLDRLAAFGDRIRVLTLVNGGKAAALNRGLAETDRPLVWIVDDDDLVRPDARARLVGALSAHPEAGFAYGRHARFEDDAATGARTWQDTGYWCHCPPEEFLVHTMEDLFAHHPGMIVRRWAYERAGPFDVALQRSEDYEMLIRLAMIARPVEVDGVVFDQRVHAGDRGSGKARVKATDRDRNWIAHDREIFERVRASLPLELYLPERHLDGPASLRRALVQRAVIHARRHMWPEAADDLDAALDASPAPLDAATRAVARRATFSKYGCGSLLADRRVQARLSALAERGAGGADLLGEIARGLNWRVRVALQRGAVSEALSILGLSLGWRARAGLTARRGGAAVS